MAERVQNESQRGLTSVHLYWDFDKQWCLLDRRVVRFYKRLASHKRRQDDKREIGRGRDD